MFSFNMDYLGLPMLGGIGVALVAGPLGAVMVWRRLAYFGDTLSHSGLLGVTLALILQINVIGGVCAIAVAAAFFLQTLQSRWLSSDTILGLLSHTTLALGLLALAAFESVRVDVLSFLYGDILTLNGTDVWIIYLGGALVLACLWRLWPSLLRVTLDPELAKVEGVRVKRVQMLYVILLAIVISIAMKIVGVLLITALLIIPAATARALAKSPRQMALLASFLGMIAVVSGMSVSHVWDVPTGPTIVVSAATLFLLFLGGQKLKLFFAL